MIINIFAQPDTLALYSLNEKLINFFSRAIVIFPPPAQLADFQFDILH